ncbi:hypothetical protein A2U01_0070015, partial [Trifolium medium]|nr:hypothetical protein [Trifolium medium]
CGYVKAVTTVNIGLCGLQSQSYVVAVAM